VTFVERIVDPTAQEVSISIIDFVGGIKQGLKQALLRKDLFPFLLMVAVTFFLLSRKSADRGWLPRHWLGNERMYLLYAACLTYVPIHLILFPDPSDRFFLFEYMIAACLMFWALSSRNTTGDPSDNRSSRNLKF
ncbi:MAG: hypothetical protein O7E57_11330, partial [Gammaproteobacteria bacterium]|nr:hypothetical protein [Gammaproteobacteria bacterium]